MADNLTGRIIRGYEMLEQIGAGGFGAVYRASQPILKREVAIKVVLPEYANSPDFIRRFEVEAELVARLEHPYIVPLFDYWREPDSAYLVLRLLRGGTLQQLLEQGEPLPIERITSILDQISSALHVAHRNGVVHRDIKPANILLDEDGNAFLTDFGIAKSTDYDSISGADDGITGSISHTPPEQIQSGKITPRTDIYALGVILYQMLTGEHPFKDTTITQMIFKHLQDPLPDLERDDIPYAINDIVQQATAKDPEDRFDDVRELATEFKSILAGNTTLALPEEDFIIFTEAENPYKGLRAFQEADADQFFGRDNLINRLLSRLSEQTVESRFLAVIGPSGSGKSSVVKAGLLPAIRNGRLDASDNWFIVEMFPGASPFKELETALMKVAVNPVQELVTKVEQENGLTDVVNSILPDDDSELVLVIDQFEELFTQVDDEEARTRFLNNLVDSVLSEQSRLRLIITMRADFYDKPLQYREFGELLRKRIETVLPMSSEELVETITRPAQLVGIDFQPGLVDAISQDVGEQSGMLPLLQYTMTELFDNRQGNTLTLAAYQDIGGVAGSLARRSEEIYTGLPFKGQAATRQLFLRLVSPGEGTEDTRRRVRRTELATTDAIDDVINLYGRYRLLTFDKDPQSREPTVEVAHEALIRTWERLRNWINENREDLRIQRRVSAAVAEWNTSGKDNSFLATGARLTQFQEWRDTTDLILNKEEETYIQTSIDAEADRKAEELRIARRVQNFQRASMVLGAMVLIAIIATGILLSQAQSAQRDASTAVANADSALATLDPARTLVAVAQTDAESAELAVVDAQQQATLAQNDLLTAQALAGNAETQVAVQEQLTAVAPTLASVDERIADLISTVQVVGATLTPAQIEIESAQSTVAAAQTDVSAAQVEADTARSDVATAQAEVLIAGQGILTSEADASIAQEEVSTAQAEVAVVEQEILTSEAEVAAAQNLVGTSQADAENAQTDVFVAIEEAQVAQADANSAQTSVALVGETQTPIAATVIAGAEQLQQQQSDLATAQVLAGNAETQIAVQEQLTAVAPTIESAETRVAEVNLTLEPAQATIDSVDAVIAGIEQEVEVAQTQAASVQSAADSIFLAVNAEQALDLGDYDLALALTFESLRLDASQARARRILNEVAFGTARLSFDETRVGELSPDSQFFVTSEGNQLVVRDVQSRRVIDRITAHNGDILDVDFSADGTRMATASADATARLWDITGWRNGGSAIEVQVLTDHTGAVNVVRFGLNDRVFTGSDDSNIIEWSVSNGSNIREYVSNTWAVKTLTFVGDGSSFLTEVDANGTPILLYWQVGNINTRYEEDALIFTKFNENATRSALGGRNGQPLTIYNTTNRQALREFGQVQGFNPAQESVTAFDFDPARSSQIAIALNADGSNRLVIADIGTGAITQSLGGVTLPRIDVLAFDPSGSLLLSASDDILTLWDVQSGTILRTLAAHTDVITDVRWSDDGRFAISRSRDDNVRLWDVTGADESLRQIYEIETTLNRGKHPGFDARGDYVIAAAWISMFSWEQQTNTRRDTVSTGDEILNIIYSPIENRAITVLPNVALLWDLDLGVNGRNRTYGDAGAQFTGAAAYSPDGLFIALDDTTRILVYDLTTGSRRGTINKPRFENGQQITGIAISPGGEFVVGSVGVRNQQDAPAADIILWDADSGELLYRFPVEHNRNINGVAVSADGNRVLSVSDDDTLIMWDVSREGASLFRRFAGHSGDVNIGRFVPNTGNSEQFVLSASDDRTMILWDIESGQGLRTFRGSPAAITGLNVSADGSQMVTTYGVLDPALSRTEPADGSAETLVYVWDLSGVDDLLAWTAANRYIRSLTQAECDQFNISDCDADLSVPQGNQSNAAPVVPPTTVASNSGSTSASTSAPVPTAVVAVVDAPVAINNGSINLNVRSSDSTAASVVGSLVIGESATILGRSTNNTQWFQIRLDGGQVGWVRSDLVNITGETDTLASINPPVVQAPPPAQNTNVPQSTDADVAETTGTNANLQISGTGIIPDPPQCLQPFTVQVDVINTGTEATTSSITVSASDRHVASGSPGPSGTATVPPLQPGENFLVEISLSVSAFFAEEHQINIQVDSGAAVAESSEGDNFSSRNYVLGSGSC